MTDPFPNILIDRAVIARRVAEMGAQLTHDLADNPPLIIPVMDGAMIFASDLLREINLTLRIHPLKASSYGADMVSSGKVTLPWGIPDHVMGMDLLIIDEILDTGKTLETLETALREAGARSIRTCVLLRKGSPPLSHADYVGFDIPDEFVVGYGLDLGGLYRNLPDIRCR